MDLDEVHKHKSHVKSKKGRKEENKKAQKVNKSIRKDDDEAEKRKRNPKAFAIQSAVKAERRVRRKEDIVAKRTHVPTVDRAPLEPPPIVVAIVGPPKVGKTTLMSCLIKNFTRQTMTDIRGPVTLVSGKKQRLTFIECR
jgi:ribosome biogenesis protein BMS1